MELKKLDNGAANDRSWTTTIYYQTKWNCEEICWLPSRNGFLPAPSQMLMMMKAPSATAKIKLSTARVPTWLDLLQCCNHVVQTLLLHWITRLCIVSWRILLGHAYVVYIFRADEDMPKMCGAAIPNTRGKSQPPPFSSAHSLFMNSSHDFKEGFDPRHIISESCCSSGGIIGIMTLCRRSEF